MKNKKALSQIVGTMLMVLLTISMIGAAWGIINNFVLNKLDSAKACYGITEEITFNTKYTCYNTSSNRTLVSVNLKEIELEGLLISVDYGTDSFVFELTNDNQTLTGLTNYPNGNDGVVLPKQDSGKTYIVERAGKPSKAYMAPKRGKEQCDIADSITNFPNCI
ncbi:MAG: hypothetical protein PF542_02895 [Nanoarchaeota archaeon]|jgi:hypothetical protein|nr:hypothetical protein [Nanoarchaeota archaeon]